MYIFLSVWPSIKGTFSEDTFACTLSTIQSVTQMYIALGQSVTFVKILTQINVQIYLYQQIYMNEYPNTFVSKNLTRTNVRISIRNENSMNIRIYSNIPKVNSRKVWKLLTISFKNTSLGPRMFCNGPETPTHWKCYLQTDLPIYLSTIKYKTFLVFLGS